MTMQPALPVAILALVPTVARAQVQLAWTGIHDGATNPEQRTQVVDTAAHPAGGVVSICKVTEYTLTQQGFSWIDKSVDVVRFDGSGATLWTTRVASASTVTAKSVAVDGQGVVYAGMNTGYYSYGLVALDAAGTVLWTRGASAGEGVETLATLPAGGVVVAGYGNGGDSAMLVEAWSASGTHQWKTLVQSPFGDADIARALAIDATGSIAVAGLCYSPGPVHLGVAKLDSAGQLLWLRTDPDNTVGNSVAFAPDGDVVVGGVRGNSTLVRRYDAQGNLRWSRASALPGDLTHVAVAADGSVWGTGTGSALGAFGLDVVHYDRDGAVLLEYRHPAASHVDVFSSGLVLGAAGQAWIGGSIVVPMGNDSVRYATILQFDASNVLDWQRDFQLQQAAPQGTPAVPIGVVRAAGDQFVLSGTNGGQQGCDAIVLALDIGDAPDGYCAGKLNSLGCTPVMSFVGTPSASAASGFSVRASSEINQSFGMFFYGLAGAASAPFHGGTLCVQAPLRRTPIRNAGGAALPAHDCSGTFALDFNAFAAGAAGGAPDPALSVPGTTVWVQAYGRDNGYAAPDNVSLSNGLQYVVLP